MFDTLSYKYNDDNFDNKFFRNILLNNNHENFPLRNFR